MMYPVAPFQAGMGGQEATNVAFDTGRRLMASGIDWDFMDFESLARAEVRDGRLHVSGEAYRVLILPALLLLTLVTALGVGLWLSALNVLYRDINYIVHFLTQFWMFITPIAYPASMIPEKWLPFYALNPMTGVVEGFRWVLLNRGDFPSLLIGISAGVSIFLLISGMFYFKRMERQFADMV